MPDDERKERFRERAGDSDRVRAKRINRIEYRVSRVERKKRREINPEIRIGTCAR